MVVLVGEVTIKMDAETEHQVLQALKRASENRTGINILRRVPFKERKNIQ